MSEESKIDIEVNIELPDNDTYSDEDIEKCLRLQHRSNVWGGIFLISLILTIIAFSLGFVTVFLILFALTIISCIARLYLWCVMGSKYGYPYPY